MHDRLDFLLLHIATVPDELLRRPLPGFGHASVYGQLIHILNCEEYWIHVLQNRTFADANEDAYPTVEALRSAAGRVRAATQNYVRTLSEEQLNTTLATRPVDWGGELRSPAFILLHVITHAFHHKGQIVAMLRILGYPAPDTDLQQV
jgi:uncharacterized damage-inducible protein DinB